MIAALVARKRELVAQADKFGREAIRHVAETAYEEGAIIAELAAVLGDNDRMVSQVRQAVAGTGIRSPR